MPTDETTFDYQISPDACERFGGEWKQDAATVDEPPSVAIEEKFAGKCMFKSHQAILRATILYLLFSPNIDRVDDPEVVTIHIHNPKRLYFDFLKSEASTVYGNTGYWRGLTEENTTFEVLFFDQEDDSLEEPLLDALAEYNDKYVDEDVLYVEVADIEDTSLEPPDFYPHEF